jgi:hypothetical protein
LISRSWTRLDAEAADHLQQNDPREIAAWCDSQPCRPLINFDTGCGRHESLLAADQSGGEGVFSGWPCFCLPKGARKCGLVRVADINVAGNEDRVIPRFA